jgi:rhamnosyltransferase
MSDHPDSVPRANPNQKELTVGAVVVTYHPTSEMVENIASISQQVDDVMVIDNGSTSGELEALHRGKERLGFNLIENGENLGIAAALNQGVAWAKKAGYDWVIFFDQDSKITDGFIQRMWETWQSHPKREIVCSVHPKYVDPDTGTESRVRRAPDGGPIMSMTSGALMPVWIFDKVGGFASEYFIDCVDFEYCFRIRAAGYLIADSRTAVLLHSAGHPSERTRLFGASLRPTHHNAVRRYYISRNRIAFYRKYLFVFPGWVVQSIYDSLRETLKCFLSEQDRLHKFRSFILGTWHGLVGKMGKREIGSESH